MNPLRRFNPQQISLFLSFAIGAFLGAIIGYFSFIVGFGADGNAMSFVHWLFIFPLAGICWGLAGSAVGCGLLYIKRHG